MKLKFWQKTKVSENDNSFQIRPMTADEFKAAKSDRTPAPSQEPDTIPQETPRYMNSFITEEFSQLKPENLSDYIIWATSGVPYFMYFLYNVIRQRDLRIGTVLMRRKFAVLDEMYVVKCENEEMKKFAEDILDHIGSKLWKLFTQLVEANLQGIKRFEINYEVVKGRVMPKDITGVSNYLYLYDETENKYHFLDSTKYDANQIMTSGISNTYDRLDFDKIPKVKIAPEKVLDVHGLDGDDRNAFLNGHTISYIIGYFFKNYNVKDMNIFIERFASPTIDAQYDGVNPTSRNNMLKALKLFKSNGWVLREKGSEITLLNDAQKGQASAIFLNTIKYWDSAFSIRTLGEEETTQMGKEGSFAALKVKKYVSEDIAVADLKVISAAINEIFKRIIDFNYSTVEEYPLLEFTKVKTLEEKKTQSEIMQNVKSIGYKPTKEYVEENLDVEIDEEEIKEPDDQIPDDDKDPDDPNDPNDKTPDNDDDKDSDDKEPPVKNSRFSRKKKSEEHRSISDEMIIEYLYDLWKEEEKD